MFSSFNARMTQAFFRLPAVTVAAHTARVMMELAEAARRLRPTMHRAEHLAVALSLFQNFVARWFTLFLDSAFHNNFTRSWGRLTLMGSF